MTILCCFSFALRISSERFQLNRMQKPKYDNYERTFYQRIVHSPSGNEFRQHAFKSTIGSFFKSIINTGDKIPEIDNDGRDIKSPSPSQSADITTEQTNVDSDGIFDALDDDNSSPAVLTDNICLVPGDPIVRIEEAPSNSRRIYTGIDISCQVDDVWNVLTAYDSLQDIIPSIVKNEVLFLTSNGARLAQVGGAKVLPGVTFTAKIVLDVRAYLENDPLPQNMTAQYLSPEASSNDFREYSKQLPLVINFNFACRLTR
jgi:hypothetical protein